MSSMRSVLHRCVEQNRAAIVSAIVNSSAHSSAQTDAQVPAADLEQMANGFFQLLIASVDGDDSVRSFYVDTVLPGVRDNGASLELMISGSARVMLQVTGLLAASLPEEHRNEALGWLADFFGSYLGETTRVWEHKP